MDLLQNIGIAPLPALKESGGLLINCAQVVAIACHLFALRSPGLRSGLILGGPALLNWDPVLSPKRGDVGGMKETI